MVSTEYIISLAQIAKLIEDNGGKIVSLDDEKLTHVVLDKRDDSRRRELMKRTSEYARRALPFSGSTQTYL
jgi:DNA ligase-4